MRGKQQQSAGDNSKQIIVAGDLHENLTLEQASQVAELVAHKVVAQEFEKADALGLIRIEKLNERVLNRLEALDKLTAFADPAFQVLLRKAQIGAASTERDGDYDMLAELLAARVVRGEERPIRAGIDRAVQIIDALDTQALTGLTVLQAVGQFGPNAGSIADGLDTMDSLYAQFPLEELPSGAEWLDHLDLLDAIRLNTVGSMKRFEDYFTEVHTHGYLASGVETEEVLGVLGEENAWVLRTAIIEHELKPGFSRLGYARLRDLEGLLPPFQEAVDTDDVLRIARETFGLGAVDQELKEPYLAMVQARPHLVRVQSWWNEIPHAAQVTSVGRVLATANAKRCDSAGLLPPLD